MNGRARKSTSPEALSENSQKHDPQSVVTRGYADLGRCGVAFMVGDA